MLGEARVEIGIGGTGNGEGGSAGAVWEAAAKEGGVSRAQGHEGDWQSVDRALRRIATRRAGLDAEEARWLREAEVCQVWRRLGMVSAIDYMERVLGYAPRAAQERLRVARALGGLPALTSALEQGVLSFSAVRELTRVATPATEVAWRDAAVGMNVRQIEELVADHRPGDRPEDPGDPEVRTRVVRIELSAEMFALWRQTRQVIDEAHGHHRSDDELVAELCNSVLDDAPAGEARGRARFQIAITVCARCRQGWQEGAGAKIAIDDATVERACCDAQHIGSIDGAGPERASQDISPSVARFVRRRDGGRCRVPGCRSARGLELHHLVHRADGGGHDAENLCQVCSSCHQAHHAGTLTITGTASRLEVHRRNERTPIEPRMPVEPRMPIEPPIKPRMPVEPPTKPRRPIEPRTPSEPPIESAGAHVCALRDDAREALVGAGWKAATAEPAVMAALATLGDTPTLEGLIREALRWCRQARMTLE